MVAEQTARAAAAGARLVVFPEATMRAFGLPLAPVAQPLDGPWADGVRAVAARHDVVVVAGMFTPAPDGRVTNTLLATGPGVEASYAKIHLYDAFGFAESATVAPGDVPVVVRVDGVGVGLATCYDVRFPDLFTALADRGARGRLPARLLGRRPRQARAVAAADPGPGARQHLLRRGHRPGRPAAAGVDLSGREGAPTGVGHSCVVGPDGTVLAELGRGPGPRRSPTSTSTRWPASGRPSRSC